MPCNSDYMNPNAAEKNSKEVAGLIVYIEKKMGDETPGWITDAATDYYGAPARLDELTEILCSLCSVLSPAALEEVIYDAHNPKARELAAWWEEHQAADKAREARERHDAEVKSMADAVGGVLSEDQKKLLREAVKTGAL